MGGEGHTDRGQPSAGGPAPSSRLLHRADQAAVAGLVLLGLAGSIAYWITRGGCRGERIEIERAEPLEAKFLVDINHADWPEIAQLPGVGETLARRIIDWRNRNGRFPNHEALLDVDGIGPATLERIKPYLKN
jgi:competence protein ComEA